MKDMLVGVNKDADASTTLGSRKETIKGRTHNAFSYIFANSLLALYKGVAYLAYLPHKLFSYLRGTNGPESLVWYANNFQNKAEQHGETCAKFISSVLSYVISSVI
ncbi:hypothetical protein [Wolbachia endosymbiont of Tettigetta isshikii]|uniref:hypothetical protein n=1 Tax=Wolbachia endosymbiont of Tettigetta isshikii TaxID=3239093 RepID=UPI0039815344